MCATFKIIILALCLSLVNGDARKHNVKQFIIQNRLSDKGMANFGAAASRSGDLSLIQFMIEARSLSDKNPQRSVECFNYYTPVLSGITDNYEADFGACLSDTDVRKADIDDETQPRRTEMQAAAAKSFELLNTCSESKNSITYFECYADEGSANSKAIYAISAHASELLAEVREKYRVIEFEESRCTNKAERNYLTSSSSTYEELQSCLRGLTPVPSTTHAPTTTAPEVTNTPEINVETTTKIFTDVPTTTTTEAVSIKTTTTAGQTTTAEDGSEGSGSTPESTTAEASVEDTTESGGNAETTEESIATTVVYNPVPPSTNVPVTESNHSNESKNSAENNPSNESENSKENGKSNEDEKSNEGENSNESKHESHENSNSNEDKNSNESQQKQINSAAKKLEELRKQLQLRREQNQMKRQEMLDKINEKYSYFGNSEYKYRF